MNLNEVPDWQLGPNRFNIARCNHKFFYGFLFSFLTTIFKNSNATLILICLFESYSVIVLIFLCLPVVLRREND